jgi:hypothetical protein
LVEKPPRERPSACSPSLFCPGGAGVGSHHGAVEHDPLEIGVGRQMIGQRLPDALLLPAREPLVETVPAAERVRHQPPRATRPRHPQNRLDEAAGRHLPTDIDPGAGPQNGVEPLPLILAQLRLSHPCKSSLSFNDRLLL